MFPSDHVATRLDTLPSSRSDGRRAVIVRAGGREPPHELYRILRQRLLLFSAVMAGTLLALLGLVFWTSPVYQLGGASFVRFSIISLGLSLAVSTASAALLQWRPPATVTGLRIVELAVTGSVAVVILWGMARPESYRFVERSSAVLLPGDLNAVHLAYSESTALRWFALLVGYGVVIPNTWRRCAAVVSVLATSPFVLLAVLGLWRRPIQADALVSVLTGLAFWIGLAVIMVIFTAYRIEVLAQEAVEARRLGRFEREVRLTATLTHPNTIQIFNYGRYAAVSALDEALAACAATSPWTRADAEQCWRG